MLSDCPFLTVSGRCCSSAGGDLSDQAFHMRWSMTIYATGRDATVGRIRPPFISIGDSDADLVPEYRDAARYASVAYCETTTPILNPSRDAVMSSGPGI